MVEFICDKQGGLKNSWKGNEKYFWLKFKRCLNMVYPLENNRENFKDIWFTWCNNQGGHNKVFRRLDRVYCKSSYFSFQSEEGHSPVIVLLAAMSDHSPISARILINKDENVSSENNRCKVFKLNTSLLMDLDNKEAIRIVTFLSKMCN